MDQQAFEQAVRSYRAVRESQAAKQLASGKVDAGTRGSVTGDPIFAGTSYLDRYRILCQRLVRERLYDTVCLVASSPDPGQDIYEPDPELGFANFMASVAGRAAYIKALET